jgi:P27 family predicted phage terminase small subunit
MGVRKVSNGSKEMKGRKPKPTKLKIIDGNPGKRPLNESEPDPDQEIKCPQAPGHLNDAAKEEWDRMAPELYDIGLLTKIDIAALEAYCTAYARWIEAEDKIREGGMLVNAPSGYPIQTPYLSIANKAIDQIKAFLTEFGMTPSSRSRISVGTGKKKTSEWDDI